MTDVDGDADGTTALAWTTGIGTLDGLEEAGELFGDTACLSPLSGFGPLVGTNDGESVAVALIVDVCALWRSAVAPELLAWCAADGVPVIVGDTLLFMANRLASKGKFGAGAPAEFASGVATADAIAVP